MRVILTMMLVAIATRSLQAEQIRLKNGDVIFASVVSLDEKTLKLKSENFGEVSVDRDSVVEIQFAEPIGSSWRSVRPGPHRPFLPHSGNPTPASTSPAPYVPSAQPTGPASLLSPATSPPSTLYNPSPYPSPATAPSTTIPPTPSLVEPPPKSSNRSVQTELLELFSEKNREAARKRAQEMVAELESLKAGKQTAEAEGMLDEYLRLLCDFVSGKPSP